VGPNGAGKSTLLKTLIGKLPPLAGTVEQGTGVRIGYFDQKLGEMNESLSLMDEIRSVRADLSPDVIRTYLAKFRFFGDDPFRTVRGLSGGERSRLAMAKIMLFPRNVLVLDEPTNHLDIPSRETLEESLRNYQGTLLVISHDRYFLDRVVTRLLVIDGSTVENHLGNYSDWRHRRAAAAPPASTAPQPSPKGAQGAARKENAPPSPAARPAAPAQAAPAETGAGRAAAKEKERERKRLERKIETLEADVAKLERELAEVRAALAADHGGDWQKLHTLSDRGELDELLQRRMSEWEGASAARAAAG